MNGNKESGEDQEADRRDDGEMTIPIIQEHSGQEQPNIKPLQWKEKSTVKMEETMHCFHIKSISM